MYQHDNRTVVTLDAGGTNFVFGAMRGCEFITEPLRKPSNADDLDRCLATLVEGFGEIISRLDTPPSQARPTIRTESSAATCPTSRRSVTAWPSGPSSR